MANDIYLERNGCSFQFVFPRWWSTRVPQKKHRQFWDRKKVPFKKDDLPKPTGQRHLKIRYLLGKGTYHLSNESNPTKGVSFSATKHTLQENYNNISEQIWQSLEISKHPSKLWEKTPPSPENAQMSPEMESFQRKIAFKPSLFRCFGCKFSGEQST